MTDDKRKELLSKAKPILFNTKMVRAILDEKKTVTRRIIKPQPLMKLCYTFAGCDCRKWTYPDKNAYKYWGDEYKLTCKIPEQEQNRLWTPPCHADDIMYVRETWAELETVHCVPYWAYKADDQTLHHSSGENFERWHPSIHMPKEAARIFLRVTNARVERLQDCGNMQAKDEGCNCCSQFARIWNSTIKKSDLDKYGWAANPWAWVIEFERID